MKNYLIQILILSFLFGTYSFAQESSNIDIKAKVKAQMLKAQSSMQIAEKQSVNKNVSFPNISTGVFRLLILILSSIIVLSLVFLRRVKIQDKILSKQFRENIRLVREEQYRKPIDYSLTPVRKSLFEKIENCFEEKTISTLARKLKIAKGEILLVNSIKNYTFGTDTQIKA